MLFRLSYGTMALLAGVEPASSNYGYRIRRPDRYKSVLELRAGVEPAHDGFADRSVPTSPPQHDWLGHLDLNQD